MPFFSVCVLQIIVQACEHFFIFLAADLFSVAISFTKLVSLLEAFWTKGENMNTIDDKCLPSVPN